jgi:hypothetical protein
VTGHDGGQVQIGEDVAVQDDRPLVEERLRVLHGTSGAQGRRLDRVADPDSEVGAVAEDRLDLLRLVRDGEDHLGHPGPGEEVQLVAEEGTVDDGGDGLRDGEGEGAEPRPLATGENYRFHDRGAPPPAPWAAGS